MDWPWRVGIIVLSGVPAIVGGGLFWHLFGHKWTWVIVWEVVLLALLSRVLYEGDKRRPKEEHH